MKKYLLSAVIFILAFFSNSKAQEFSISIDGQKDAFYESLTGPGDGMIFLPSRCYLLDIGTPPDDDADLSAVAWVAYDDNYFYCYVEVTDDIVTASNAERFQNDCIEIKFDPDPSSGSGTATSNLRMTALGPDNAENPSGVDNLNGSGHLENSTGQDWVVAEDNYARRLIDGGYALEFRVDFAYINEPEDSRFMIERKPGNIFGAAINIGDNDATSREHMLQWSAGHTDQAHSDASQHGTVTFLENHKLKFEAISPRDPSIVNDSADAWYSNPLTGIIKESNIASSFKLFNNYPNPFNPATIIKFSVPNLNYVTLKIFNSLGQEVAQLISQDMDAGVYETKWNADAYSSGVYYYRLTAGNLSETRKLVLMK